MSTSALSCVVGDHCRGLSAEWGMSAVFAGYAVVMLGMLRDMSRMTNGPYRHYSLIALGALVLIAPLTACSAVQSGTSVSDVSADAGSAKSKSKSKSDLPNGVYHFGRNVRFKDGSTLKVGEPVEFTRDKYAAGGEKFKHDVKFKVTFTNNSKRIFDPALTTGSVSSGDAEGESIFQEGLDAPDNKLLPGRKVTWWMGYGVKSSRKVTLTVSVGFLDYEDAIFTNEPV
jgi:hypothetical protein